MGNEASKFCDDTAKKREVWWPTNVGGVRDQHIPLTQLVDLK